MLSDCSDPFKVYAIELFLEDTNTFLVWDVQNISPATWKAQHPYNVRQLQAELSQTFHCHGTTWTGMKGKCLCTSQDYRCELP